MESGHATESGSNKKPRRSEDKEGESTSAASVKPEESKGSSVISVTDQPYNLLGRYTGDWDEATKQPHGQGQWKQGGTFRYEGSWDQGSWTGEGTVYDENGVLVCKGTYRKGELHGFATLYKEDGVTIDEQSYHVYGTERPELKSKEDFDQAVQQEDEKRRQKEQARNQQQRPVTVSTFSMTLTKDSPIMSAPIDGLFPRYAEVPLAMLSGKGFEELEDHEIPTPTNLEAGKTREDWLTWVREFYPRK